MEKRALKLCGIDIGSTTTRMIAIEAGVFPRSDKPNLNDFKLLGTQSIAYTPFRSEMIDIDALDRLLSKWLSEMSLRPNDFWAGGILLTGLAARSLNAQSIVEWGRTRFRNILTTSAQDHLFESWIAYQANCAVLSAAKPQQYFLNFDIGGGTTNVALGRGSEVLDCGCWSIGARHVAFRSFDQAMKQDAKKIVANMIDALKGILASINGSTAQQEAEQSARMVPFSKRWNLNLSDVIITFSGGVGEVLYDLLLERKTFSEFEFNDLGVLLARGILNDSILSKDSKVTIPQSLGAATVLGLAIHSVQVSGSSIYCHPKVKLPLNQVLVLGAIDLDSNEESFRVQLSKSHFSQRSIGFTLNADYFPTREKLLKFSESFRRIYHDGLIPSDQTLVFLTRQNFAQTLGNYMTDWGAFDIPLLLIDEVESRSGKYCQIGEMSSGYLPVTFYGFQHGL